MKYIKLFSDHNSYSIYEQTLDETNTPNVSKCILENEIHYTLYLSSNPVNNHDYSQDYLTFKALSQGTMTIYYDEVDGSPITISYSIDNGTTWTQITTSEEPYTVGTFNVGDKLLLKGNNSSYWENSLIGGTAMLEVCGNIMSMLYGDNFVGQTTLTEDYTFNGFFSHNTNLISAENLILPATTLISNCYQSMFHNCTSLTTAPKLPATTLANSCYDCMFDGCISLTTAPELPVTTLANRCYDNMFLGCTSLTSAPELPATTLASNCYISMFHGCTSLTTAPELPATTLASGCYNSMFKDCTSLTTAPELPVTTLAIGCYNYMFEGCTSLTTAPELPATTLTNYCYNYMFHGCTSLSSIKCLATNISASNCISNWVNGVAASGTFIKAESMSYWTFGVNGIPSGWTIRDAA